MVPEEEITPIRIKFTKTGSLMYISHLDLVRTVQRIMVRAGIDIRYTEGFNPQPKMVFTPPLSIGVESLCEFVDIKINSPMSTDEIKKRLSENFPDEMRVLAVYVPTAKLSDIAYTDYIINMESPTIDEDTENKVRELFSRECTVVKASKKGEREINVTDYIKSLDVKSSVGAMCADVVLCADSENYLNPELFIKAIREKLGILSGDVKNEYYSVMRKEMLQKDLKVFE